MTSQPHKSWGKKLARPPLKFLLQATFCSGGFLVKVKGEKATQDEALICVTAPHSALFDQITHVVGGLLLVVVASQNGQIPVAGKLILSTRPVLVIPEDPNSRKNTRNENLKQVTSERNWPQILIFLEGVHTYCTCLVTFKLGDFSSGVPVWPVATQVPKHTGHGDLSLAGVCRFLRLHVDLESAFH